MELGTSVDTFLSLVRAGLWENCDKFQASGFRLQVSDFNISRTARVPSRSREADGRWGG